MTTLHLPPLEIGARRPAVIAAVAAAEVDCLVVTDPSNLRWLTGFTGSSAALLVTDGTWRLYTDSRYATQAPEQLASAGVEADVVVGGDIWRSIADLAPTQRVGVEADHVTWSTVRPILDEHGVDALVGTESVIAGLRAFKDDGELARIRMAVTLADAALAAIVPSILPGVSEIEVARRLDEAIRDGGGAGPAYRTIVATGPNSALPHAEPSERRFSMGDLVVVDVGAEVDGYRSDMTRSFVIGPPSAAQQQHLDVVLAAQQAGAAAAQVGAGCAAVDMAARAVIEEAGWGEAFGHGTGHGVGLDIHELPRVSARSTASLEPGMVFTIEPGVYLPGLGGVRWEDLFVVSCDAVEVLTGSAKDPLLLG